MGRQPDATLIFAMNLCSSLAVVLMSVVANQLQRSLCTFLRVKTDALDLKTVPVESLEHQSNICVGTDGDRSTAFLQKQITS